MGLRHFHAIDPTRDDVSTEKRQFVVSVFYPAIADETVSHARIADILAPRDEDALKQLARTSGFTPEEKDKAFTYLRSLSLRAQRDLEPMAQGPYPILIYYPGAACHRFSNADLCEQFAATGYIVFCLEGPRDAPVVVFPDGTIVPRVPFSDENYIWPRVADVRFLLDSLGNLNTEGMFARQLDLSRIAMFGHSRGGYLSNICAVEDARIRAAVNMDGFLWGLDVPGTGLTKFPSDFQERARALKIPILRLRSEQESREAIKAGFEEEVSDVGGDFIFAALKGFSHNDFATVWWLNGAAEYFDRHSLQPPTAPPRVELLRGLLFDFFDTYLLNRRLGMELLVKQPAEVELCFRCQTV